MAASCGSCDIGQVSQALRPPRQGIIFPQCHRPGPCIWPSAWDRCPKPGSPPAFFLPWLPTWNSVCPQGRGRVAQGGQGQDGEPAPRAGPETSVKGRTDEEDLGLRGGPWPPGRSASLTGSRHHQPLVTPSVIPWEASRGDRPLTAPGWHLRQHTQHTRWHKLGRIAPARAWTRLILSCFEDTGNGCVSLA